MEEVGKSGSVLLPVAVGKAAPVDRNLEARFEVLLDRVRQNRSGEDLGPLRRAFAFAAEHHQQQTRESGEPYLSHPLEVALILADLRLDVTTLCAALLHDIVEDTRMPISAIATRVRSGCRASGGRRDQDRPPGAGFARRSGRSRASARCSWPW